MSSGLLVYIPEHTVLWNFHKIDVLDIVCIFKVARMHSFREALNTYFLLFQKKFLTQKEVEMRTLRMLVELCLNHRLSVQMLKLSPTSCFTALPWVLSFSFESCLNIVSCFSIHVKHLTVKKLLITVIKCLYKFCFSQILLFCCFCWEILFLSAMQ